MDYVQFVKYIVTRTNRYTIWRGAKPQRIFSHPKDDFTVVFRRSLDGGRTRIDEVSPPLLHQLIRISGFRENDPFLRLCDRQFSATQPFGQGVVQLRRACCQDRRLAAEALQVP